MVWPPPVQALPCFVHLQYAFHLGTFLGGRDPPQCLCGRVSSAVRALMSLVGAALRLCFRRRRGHSIAYDHLNEIFVGLFKRIALRGNATPQVLRLISKNLTFLKCNWESLKDNIGIRRRGGSKRKTSDTNFATVLRFFREKRILSFSGTRTVDTVWKAAHGDAKQPQNFKKLHSNVVDRVPT